MSNPDTIRTDYIVQLDNHERCDLEAIAPLDLREAVKRGPQHAESLRNAAAAWRTAQ